MSKLSPNFITIHLFTALAVALALAGLSLFQSNNLDFSLSLLPLVTLEGTVLVILIIMSVLWNFYPDLKSHWAGIIFGLCSLMGGIWWFINSAISIFHQMPEHIFFYIYMFLLLLRICTLLFCGSYTKNLQLIAGVLINGLFLVTVNASVYSGMILGAIYTFIYTAIYYCIYIENFSVSESMKELFARNSKSLMSVAIKIKHRVPKH